MTNETSKATAIVKAAESAAISLTPTTVKAYINALASDQEIALFLNQCVMFGLNPFKREIYLIKYSAKDPATFVTGYEVYLKRADRTANWGGMETGTEDDKDGQPIKAWAKVYRKDWGNRPLYHEVFFSEYVQTKAEWVNGQATGKKIPTRFWAEKPRTMLKKVAVAQALRMAFPDEFGGMPYVSEEMPIDHAKLPTAEVKTEAPIDKYPDVKPAEVHAPAPVKDEWTDPPATTAEPEVVVEPDRCSSADIKAMGIAVSALTEIGVDEGLIYGSINKRRRQAGLREVAELSELTHEDALRIIVYLHNWKKKKQAEAEAGGAA